MATAARVLDHKYRLGSVLQQSERALIVAATHLELREPVVIKVLDPEHRDPRFAARLRREARQAIAIRSEHVARYLDIGHLTDGRPYVVMERLEGETLAEHIESKGPLSLTAGVDVVLQTCEALAAAHARGILHRDLRTSNLFASQQPGGRIVVKVLNFGTARAIDAKGMQEDHGLTVAVLALDAPDYKAPEQIVARRDLDARVDIWALGVVMYETITGRRPFAGATPQEIVRRVMTGDVAPAPELPADIEAVIQRCLRPRPDERWSSVAEIAAALAPFASAETASYPARIRAITESPVPHQDEAPEDDNDPPTMLRDVLALTRTGEDTQTRAAVSASLDTHSGLPRLDDGRTNARSFPWIRVDELKQASRAKAAANNRKWVVASVFFATLFVVTTALVMLVPRFVVDLHVETHTPPSLATSAAPRLVVPLTTSTTAAPPVMSTAGETPSLASASIVPPAPPPEEAPSIAPQRPAATVGRAARASSSAHPSGKREEDPWGWDR